MIDGTLFYIGAISVAITIRLLFGDIHPSEKIKIPKSYKDSLKQYLKNK